MNITKHLEDWFFRGSRITDDGWSRKLVVLGLSLSYNWFNTCGVFWSLMKIIWQTNTLCYQTGSFFWYKNDLDFLALFSRLSINIFSSMKWSESRYWSNHILLLKLSATSCRSLSVKVLDQNDFYQRWGRNKTVLMSLSLFFIHLLVDICQNSKIIWGKIWKEILKFEQFE